MYSSLKIIAGATGTERDQKLASYLDFFAGKIPTEKITHLHVINKLYDTNRYYSHYDDAFEPMAKVVREEELEPLLDTYTNVEHLVAKVIHGRLVDEFQNLLENENAKIVALGKRKKGSSTLAKNIIRKMDCNTMIVPENSKKSFTNILVPVDLSKHSGKLLANAIALQKASLDAVFITCLHAYEIPNMPYYKILRTEMRVAADTRETIKEAFDKFIAKHQTDDVEITPVLIEEANSWPSHYIIKYIDENDIDFVIMGTQRHNLIDALLGSTVEKVISNNDKCPILIIK